MKHIFLCLLPILVLLSGLTACTTVHEHDYPRDRAPYYESRPVYSPYDYYFYPNVAVYFQISTGFYFYEDRGRWVRVRQLPSHIHLDARYRRQMVIRDPYPYVRYPEHARQYGGRDDDRDRRGERRPERDAWPAPRDDDRNGRGPERESREHRDEWREPPLMKDRGQEQRERAMPGRSPDDDRRGAKPQDNPRDEDKSPGYGRDRIKDGRPDARSPSRNEDSAPKARGREEPGDSRDDGHPGKPEGSSKRDGDKQVDKGHKGRSPDGKDNDDEDRDSDRRGPGTR